MVGGADLLLSFPGGVEEGGRCGLGISFPGRNGFQFGKSAASERFSYILGEVDRPGVNHEIGGDALSETYSRGMGRGVGVTFGYMEPLGVPVALGLTGGPWV